MPNNQSVDQSLNSTILSIRPSHLAALLTDSLATTIVNQSRKSRIEALGQGWENFQGTKNTGLSLMVKVI
jgi:hypothetical protein